jgi:hypothetical protein
MRAAPSRQFSDLRNRAAESIAALPIERPVFSLSIGWANSYDELLSHKLDVQPETSVLEKLLSIGRVIISGRGGGGKTQLLRRVARKAIDMEILPVIIDLTEWSAADYEGLQEWSHAQGGGPAFLLHRFSRPAITPGELAWVPPSRRKLILIDGLNELTQPVGMQILELIDRFAQSQILTSVMVTDRLVRRTLSLPQRFALGLVMPFGIDLIRKYFPDISAGNAARLDLPFFLNAALKERSLSGKRSAIHEEFFVKHARLTPEDFDRLAAAAYKAYEINKARSFKIATFEADAGTELVKRLAEAGIIVCKESIAYFSHHLKHDYLAARYVSRLPETAWTPAVLDTLSFRRSSFDAVALVFEQLTVLPAEAFLRAVYDWNLYAAGYALGEGISSGLELPGEMQAVILAMLAEKHFDNVVATRERAADALNLVPGPVARPFQSAQSLAEVFEAVRALASSEGWFLNWRDLFTRPPEYTATENDVRSLEDADSITGWTMANVLRRVTVGPELVAVLKAALASEVGVVRWRVAHVLGAFPSEENAKALLNLVDRDGNDDVRYGAVRSLVDEAVRGTAELRRLIEDAIIERIPMLMKASALVDELTRALIVADAPGGWGRTVLKIGGELFRRAPDTEQMDRWRTYLAHANRRYGLLD